jgi:hypothetical protein
MEKNGKRKTHANGRENRKIGKKHTNKIERKLNETKTNELNKE